MAAAIMVVALLPAAGVALAESMSGAAPAVIVNEKDGVYSVSARFELPQSPAAVLAVLTDYEEIPRFMSDIKVSVVLERAEGRALVEQEAVSKAILFSKRVHLVLEITEGPDTLRFRDRCGRSFARYEGSWRVTGQNGHTVITYELVTQPSFDVPEFLLKRVLRRDSTRMIDQLRQRIAAR